jgi:hypothetical protein
MKQIDIVIPEIIQNNFILVPIPSENGDAHVTNSAKMKILKLIAEFKGWKQTILKQFQNQEFVGTIEQFQAINGDKVIINQETTENENVFKFTYNTTKEVVNIIKQEFGMLKIGLMLKQLLIDATLWKISKTHVEPIQTDATNKSNQILEQTKEQLLGLDNLKLT